MKKEMQDELGDELSIFAHYCLETPHLAKSIPMKQYTKSGGINDMVTTTFSGHGRAMKTGASTINLFAMTARNLVENPHHFKGFTIDPKKLKKTIQQIAAGQLSIDEVSWIWEETNFIVTAQSEVFYFMPE